METNPPKAAYRFSGEAVFNYDHYLGPVLFEPYARDLALRIPADVQSVLELAAGTGRFTKNIRKTIPFSTKLVATDISPDMLNFAKNKLGDDSIEYFVADIQDLPFEDEKFDCVVCQFGLMFLEDRQKGFNEVFRVLKPGGTFLFNTWNATHNIPLMKIIFNDVILPFFEGEDLSKFLLPFTMNKTAELIHHLNCAGFRIAEAEVVELESTAPCPGYIVDGLLLKHSLRKEVERKDPAAVDILATKMEGHIEQAFGPGVKTTLSALVGRGVK